MVVDGSWTDLAGQRRRGAGDDGGLCESARAGRVCSFSQPRPASALFADCNFPSIAWNITMVVEPITHIRRDDRGVAWIADSNIKVIEVAMAT